VLPEFDMNVNADIEARESVLENGVPGVSPSDQILIWPSVVEVFIEANGEAVDVNMVIGQSMVLARPIMNDGKLPRLPAQELVKRFLEVLDPRIIPCELGTSFTRESKLIGHDFKSRVFFRKHIDELLVTHGLPFLLPRRTVYAIFAFFA